MDERHKGYERDESTAQRLDRNFSELLQELRVAQMGIQILFAFLLSIAFQNQFHAAKPPSWLRTIAPRLRLREAISTPTRANPIAISYATICAAERMAPRNAYFEFAAQPAMITP